MKMVSIVESEPRDPAYPRKSTLVLEPDGGIRVLGNLPHNYAFKPATSDDAARLIEHLKGGMYGTANGN